MWRFGVPYTGGLTATGGVPPYTWSILQYALPPGLSINASTGQVTGTPTQAGTFQVKIAVTDSDETQFFRGLGAVHHDRELTAAGS